MTELGRLKRAIFRAVEDRKINKLRLVMHDDGFAIYELRGRSYWNKGCTRILGLGNELGTGKPGSKCVIIMYSDTGFFVSVPDSGGTFTNTAAETLALLHDMIA